MDFLSKDALLKYFQQAIGKEAGIEIEQLKLEINQLKREARTLFENELKEEKEHLLELHVIEERKVRQQELVALSRKLDLEVMKVRTDLLEDLFSELKAKINAFKQSKDYQVWFKSVLSKYDLTKSDTIEVGSNEDFVQSLTKGLNIKVNPDIIGGFYLYAKNQKTIVDETFNTKLSDAKTWFYDHANWFGE